MSYKKLIAMGIGTAIMALLVSGATVPPLQQLTCPDALPSSFCTTLNADLNALRSGVNAVSTTQAPDLLPKAGGTATGQIKINQAGVLIGSTTSGISAGLNALSHVTVDAGLIHMRVVGTDMRTEFTLPGNQNFVIASTVDGGLDGGNPANLMVYGGTSIYGLASYTTNADALDAGLAAGTLYRCGGVGAGISTVCVVYTP